MINAIHIWCDTKIYILWHWSLVNLTNYTYDCFMSSPLHGLVWKGLFTHWGRVTHIYVGNLTIIGPDNGLWPGRCQAIIWTNAGMLLIGPWGTNFSEILIGIHTFSFKKINLKMSSASISSRPQCVKCRSCGDYFDLMDRSIPLKSNKILH